MKIQMRLPLISMAGLLFLSGASFADNTRILKLGSHMNFGSVNLGQEITKTLSISNMGNSDLNVSRIRFHDRLDGTYTGNFSGIIHPAETRNVSITFQPKAGLAYTGLLYVESDRTNSGDRSRVVRAIGLDVNNTVTTRVLDFGKHLTFGTVDVNTSVTAQLTLRNRGNSDLHISGLTFHERGNGAFTGNFTGVIAPHGERNVTITFRPTMGMPFTGRVYVQSDRTNTARDRSRVLRGNGFVNLNPALTLEQLQAKIANNEDVTSVNTSGITDMSNLFKNNSTFNQDISGWDVSSVTNMDGMFDGALAFNQDISSWNVSAVTNMRKMFSGALAFNWNLNGWNVSNVLDMSFMFQNAIAFNNPLSGWDISAVTTMESMFAGASLFNQPLNWSFGNIGNMAWMFQGALAFNQPLNWNVSSVLDMTGMFSGATSFDQNLGGWNISLVSLLGNMFDGVTLSTPNYDSLLNGWSLLNLIPNLSFSAGNSQSSSASAAARLIFENTFGWTVVDGGLALTLEMAKIVAYAEDGLVAPTLLDYTTAGVVGVTAGNLVALNTAVDALVGVDVNTVAKLNAIVAGLGGGGAVDTEDPDATLKRPVFANGETIPTLNNQIEGADIGRAILLNASGSTDNVGVTTYTFMQNLTGVDGIANYTAIPGCENIVESTCNVVPTEATLYTTGPWAVTYYRVEAHDAAGNTNVSGNRYVRLRRAVADTENPDAKLERPLFANGDTIPTLNNEIKDENIGRSIKLDASASTDNIAVTSYTFMQNTSGTDGIENYTVIPGCENIVESTCNVVPTDVSGYTTGTWAVTYYRSVAYDAAGNSEVSGNRYVRVKKAPVDNTNPNATLERPVFANGDNIPTLNNQIKDGNIGRAILLNASGSTDNIAVTSYTFMQNTSGTDGIENYTVISGCENIAESTCTVVPTNVSGYTTGTWAVTYYRSVAYDAAGNSNVSGNRYVRVKK